MAERGEGVAVPDQRQGQNQQNQQENQQPQQQIRDPAGQLQHLNINWSNFKPEFSGKPDEDAEVHLLHSNDWMNAHHFIDGVKVQGICLKDSKNTSRKWSMCSVLFIIPVIIDIHGHRFEIYTLVSEIHENVDLVLGIKNVFDLEGVINLRDCCFKFLNISVPIFSEKEVVLKPGEQKLIRVKAPFVDEISGMAIIKILDEGTYSTLLIKLKFTCNKVILDIVNKGKDTMIFMPEEMIGSYRFEIIRIL